MVNSLGREVIQDVSLNFCIDDVLDDSEVLDLLILDESQKNVVRGVFE